MVFFRSWNPICFDDPIIPTQKNCYHSEWDDTSNRVFLVSSEWADRNEKSQNGTISSRYGAVRNFAIQDVFAISERPIHTSSIIPSSG